MPQKIKTSDGYMIAKETIKGLPAATKKVLSFPFRVGKKAGRRVKARLKKADEKFKPKKKYPQWIQRRLDSGQMTKGQLERLSKYLKKNY